MIDFFKKMAFKIGSVFLRIRDLIRFFPKRFFRIFDHFRYGFLQLKKRPRKRDWLFWGVELNMLILDLFGIGEIYESFQEFIKFNIRPLNEFEKKIVTQYFGNQLNINRIRIDEKAFLGPPQHHFAYVSFYTINSWGSLSSDIFLHEMVHVWQYETSGITYMSRALAAQGGKRGYHYGGIDLLRKLKARGRKLTSFNPEHQAEIVQDHFRLKSGLQTRRGFAMNDDLKVYDWFVKDLEANS